ncbi:MAG: hypothetical protein AAGA58_09850 [Verrucomicrobiota bacterium]
MNYSRHLNQRIILRIVWSLFKAVVGYFLAGFVSYWMFRFLNYQFSLDLKEPVILALTAAFLAVLTLSGWLQWKKERAYNYEDFGFYPGFEPTTTGGAVVEMYAHRVSGVAFILTKLFLLGPIGLLDAIKYSRSFVPDSPTVVRETGMLLESIRAKEKWHSASEYAGQETALSILIRLRLVDFSEKKGRLKAK